MEMSMSDGIWRLGAAAAACCLVAGCSTVGLTSDKIDYGRAVPPRALDVPPDLSQLTRDERYAVPARGTVTASASAAAAAGRAQPQSAVTEVAPASSKAKLERAGTQRWLAVDAPPEQAFTVVREYLPTIGLAIEREDPKLGIVETVWAENRAKLPQDIIRRTLGRILDSVYSTGEQDKYRVRVERTAANTSEIFVSHRGMIEVYTSSARDQTKWQPRPSDPEMEAELLQRLALRFAPPPAAATAAATAYATPATAVAAVAPPELARLLPPDGTRPARVSVSEPFDRAWRRVGLALDRGGFTVEDRDRARGVYFVRYLDPEIEQKQREQQGFFSRLFGRDPKVDAQQFRVLVTAAAERAEVTVQDRDGKPDGSTTAGKILAQINEQLR
jgi:outer membrane protein assembly factor BamC